MDTVTRAVVTGWMGRFFVGAWVMSIMGCSASQKEARLSPQVAQIHQRMESWAGEYRGRIDHGRWYLATGSIADQWRPLNYNPNTDGWQREEDVRVDLKVRFVPDEMGGQLQLSLCPVDTFQVLPWNLSYSRFAEDLKRRAMEKPRVEFEFRVPGNIIQLDDHELAGSWRDDNSSSPFKQAVEFSFEKGTGEVSGTLKYRSRIESPGEYRSEEKHEMVLTHLTKNERK